MTSRSKTGCHVSGEAANKPSRLLLPHRGSRRSNRCLLRRTGPQWPRVVVARSSMAGGRSAGVAATGVRAMSSQRAWGADHRGRGGWPAAARRGRCVRRVWAGKPGSVRRARGAAGRAAGTQPDSASFISASTGWLLAVPPCAAHGCRSLRMRATTDGGRHWSAVAAPPARVSSWPTVIFGDSPPEIPPGAVNSVLFASRLDGRAYSPGLWATHDGGPARTCCGSTGISTPRAQPHPGAVVALLGAGPGHRQGVGPVSDRQCP
jgi:hypothetical protein